VRHFESWNCTLGRWLLLVCCVLAGSASAQMGQAGPDPITFRICGRTWRLAPCQGWLDEGLNPEYEAAHIGTGLMVAAWYGHIEMMALFVERGADLRRSNRNGEQALQLAAWGGHLEAVKWLIEHGAPLERQGNQWGALHYAVFNGHEKVVSDLMARGANVNARAPNGATPLMLAAREGRDGLARVLLEAGANTRSRATGVIRR
jgi:ankyrin repeat protein